MVNHDDEQHPHNQGLLLPDYHVYDIRSQLMQSNLMDYGRRMEWQQNKSVAPRNRGVLVKY